MVDISSLTKKKTKRQHIEHPMKAIVLGTILFLCIVALITNSKYIRVQTNTIVSEQERGVTVSKGLRKKGGAEVESSNAGDTEEEGDDSFDAGNEP